MFFILPGRRRAVFWLCCQIHSEGGFLGQKLVSNRVFFEYYAKCFVKGRLRTRMSTRTSIWTTVRTSACSGAQTLALSRDRRIRYLARYPVHTLPGALPCAHATWRASCIFVITWLHARVSSTKKECLY